MEHDLQEKKIAKLKYLKKMIGDPGEEEIDKLVAGIKPLDVNQKLRVISKTANYIEKFE